MMNSNAEDDEALPLLVRKLAIFRKSLVRERGLRIDCEAEARSLAEKLKLTSKLLEEREQLVSELGNKCRELQGQIKEQQEIRSNEQKLEKIFSSFGTKKSVENENKLLKKEVLSLKRNREGYTLRIEELEDDLDKIQQQNSANQRSFRTKIEILERQLKDKEEVVVQTNLICENMKSKLRSIEKYREQLELEKKNLLEDRDTLLLDLEREKEEKNDCLKKLKHMVETNRIVQDMEDLENDLNEKLIRSRSNSAANGRNTPDVHSRRGSSDGNFHREDIGIYKQKQRPINWENGKDAKDSKDHGTRTSVEELIPTGHQYDSAQFDEVDKVGFDVLVKEFNVHKLRDFFPKRPAKITIRKQLLSGAISIVVERAGVARIHPAETIKGASFDDHQFLINKTSDSITSSYSSPNIVTFKIEYFNQKTDVFESHQRSKICSAINEALQISRKKPGMRNVSKEFPLYSEGATHQKGNFSDSTATLDYSRGEAMFRSVSVPKGALQASRQLHMHAQNSWAGNTSGGNDSAKMQSTKSEECIQDELQFFFGL
eukprot:g1273.t1